MQLGGEVHVVHNTHVQLVFQQLGFNLVGIAHQGLQLYLGEPCLKLVQHRWKPGGPKGDVGPHPQPVGALVKLILRLLKPPQDFLGGGQQRFPGLGQIDPAVHPLDSEIARVALQLPNGQAYRGLGGA